MPHPPRLVAAHGRTLPIEDWARLSGLSVQTIRSRLDKLGWPAERAVSEKADRRFRRGGRPARGVPRSAPRLRGKDGVAFVRWRQFGRDCYRSFGKFGSDECLSAYRRFCAEWSAGAFDAADPSASPGGLSVAGLVARWVAHCDQEYRKLGRRTSEYHVCQSAARPLVLLYGTTRAAEFGPDALRAVRQKWVGDGYARTTINGYTIRAVRCFRWGLSRSLVPAATVAALESVPGLREGRTAARETAPRKPVPDAAVGKTLANLPATDRGRVVGAMVQVQRLAGLRPQHVAEMRAGDIDQSGEVWRYTPPASGTKTLHLGKRPAFYLGPKAQAVLSPLLDGKAVGDHVFGYRRGERVYRVSRAEYARTVKTVCLAARVEPWTPHQLRHALATEVAARFRSIDHAAAAIGDTRETAAAVYVHVDPHERARIEVARAMG